MLVLDASERVPASAVDGTGIPGTPPAGGATAAPPAPGGGAARPRPVVYERTADGWVQYWIWYRSNPQDRGILRSGRHAGDWELAQYRSDGSEAVYAQHSGAERCGRRDIELRGGRPVVYVANGSHASYFHAGTRDRLWPDPNDEADGRGAVQRPRAVPVTADSPPWMRYPGYWGGAREGWFPSENSSPRGPAFQGESWDDPEAFARSARPCSARRCITEDACDGTENAVAIGSSAALALIGFGWWRRRRRTAAG